MYINDFESISQLYNYNPAREEDYFKRAREIGQITFQNRQQLVDILYDYNLRLGCGTHTLDNLKRLSDPDSLAVVTGQQAGLFTGPLYTIYKACTTIILAKDLSQKMERPVVPVFWVASEDHDFEEVNHFFIPNLKNKPERITSKLKPAGKYSVGQIEVPKDWQELIQLFKYHTPETEAKTEIIKILEQTALESDNFADWFARLMSCVFKPYGLIFIDPMVPSIRRLLQKGLYTALEVCSQINNNLLEKEKIFKQLDLAVPIVNDKEGVNLFLYHNNERMPLKFETSEDFYLNSDSKISFTREDLEGLIEMEPSRFSPNVVLRPIFQDLLLPTLCYVAGPGEIAYYGQLRDVYPLFGLQMPIIYPRTRLTIFDPASVELMAKYNLELGQISHNMKEQLEHALRGNLPVNISQVVEELSCKIEQEYMATITTLAQIDGDLINIGRENLRRIKYQLGYLQKKSWQKHRRNNKTIVEDFNHLQDFIFPLGKPQERVYNIMYFIAQYGLDFIETIINKMDIGNFNQQIMR